MYCFYANEYCTTATGVNPIAVNIYIISFRGHSESHRDSVVKDNTLAYDPENFVD